MFAYLPITLLAYYLVPRQGRNIFLFIVNLIFYGWGEPKLVMLMVFNIFFNYIGGWLVDKYRADAKKKKLFLILTCVLDIGILAVFKYKGMITESLNMLPFLNIPELQISLPIGISFYTFQTMSYVIDVYRDDAPVSKNFINFGTYVALFPQLIAGPIVRYRDVAEQLVNRRETLEMFTKGVKLFMVGLAKKADELLEAIHGGLSYRALMIARVLFPLLQFSCLERGNRLVAWMACLPECRIFSRRYGGLGALLL